MLRYGRQTLDLAKTLQMLTCTEFCHEADTVTDSVNILCSLGLTPRSRCCCGRTRARVMNRRTFICGLTVPLTELVSNTVSTGLRERGW
jgi:hypothetical protein